MGATGYTLSPDHKNVALSLAEMTFGDFKSSRGHYFNNPKSHLVGRLGEFAAFHWFADNGFEPRFCTERTHCDIYTTAGRCEVKTWSDQHWDSLGRSVSVTQLASITRKADFILWCSVGDVEVNEPEIILRGWCDVAVIDKYEPLLTGKVGRQIYNYQLQESDIQPMSSLKVMA
jgi:hypothetical protein